MTWFQSGAFGAAEKAAYHLSLKASTGKETLLMNSQFRAIAAVTQ
jgi:hypothetical protein